MAKQFDFVMSQVNVASYINELHGTNLTSIKKLFLLDHNHPDHVGHLVVAFMILNLLKGKGEWLSTKMLNHQ